MRIKKGESVVKLAAPLYELFDVAVRGKKCWMRLEIVPLDEIKNALHNGRVPGRPQCAALVRGGKYLLVWPVPDRRYDCEVIGSRLVKE